MSEVVTIQKTSKKLKLALVICRLGYLAAIIIAACEISRPSIAVLVFLLSAIGALFTRFLIWWNHA